VSRYCVRLRGELDQIAASFPGFDTTGRSGVVAIRGDFDEAGLHGVLERARAHRYEIVDLYRTAPDDYFRMPR
jgi:hypothetical protein